MKIADLFEDSKNELHVVRMDPKTKFSHLEDEKPLLVTSDAGEAHDFAFKLHKKTGDDIGIYSPRLKGYNGRYRKQPHDGQPRDSKGRFDKRNKEQA